MPSAWVSFATIARVNEADSAEIASSSRGTKAASLTSSWSGSGRPDMYARRKTRNATFGDMPPEKTWNEMAFCPRRPSPRTGFHGSQGHVHARAVPEENLAIGQLRRVPRRTTPRLFGEQGRTVVRFHPGHPDEAGEAPPPLRSVDPATGVLAGRTVARDPIGLRGRRELQHLRDARRRR